MPKCLGSGQTHRRQRYDEPLLPLLVALLHQESPILHAACTAAAPADYYDLCVQSMEQDAMSDIADVSSLDLISANLTLVDVARTLYLVSTWVK